MNAISNDKAFMNLPHQFFFKTLITVDGQTLYLHCACAITLKIAKILAVQASAQLFKNNCCTSTIASKIVAWQVSTSGY